MGVANFLGDLKVLYTAATTKPPSSDTVGSLPLLVQQHATRSPDGMALLYEDEKVTWQQLNDRANRVAAALTEGGVEKGDCVSLLMQNRIEFVACMLGIHKVGAIAGMINTNLTKKTLVHCINLIESKKCIFGEELVEPLKEVTDQLDLKDGEDYLFVSDGTSNTPPNWAINLNVNDTSNQTENPPAVDSLTMGDIALYIFTSGTTGLPKAAIVSNKRILPTSGMSADMLLRIDSSDRMYNCLPLYHGTGLMVGLGAAFHVGASTVIRRRLSVSAFWEDIRKYNCTSFVYIGEFVRYLMSRPPQKNDAHNPVRTIVGNGLRPDIWLAFKQRFDIERIGEFYGASEGNGGFANVFNKDCTVGLGIAPVKLARYDVARDELIKDSEGFCSEVEDGDPGLLLIQITETSKFEGYTSDDASQKKIIKDAFEPGDMYFDSGDLMKTVDVGFAFYRKHYQFVDRVGDTFRWKSENVSTNEVGELINSFSDVVFTNVYGVEIPGTDGRAGMAAIVLREGLNLSNLDLQSLTDHIVDCIPPYARPIFIRVLNELPTTTTHKLRKNDLRDHAFHLDHVQDDLLVMKPGASCYTRLDSDFYDQIMQRSVAF
ncbi:MAG TPA: long-chain-acyl-CoA synthetase [Pseudomonadales bacterium]|jgi:citronellyl-CoA synthetase|nr:long-chain-acyl-CoA synthetase [Gammaproteobacteria bacterium]MDP6027143.1 long-chain-acyl-CoA synthetase [Pseudomonadales bacterium]MDP6314617.1 long-chain-acyl-CoA synthetase [Pseudomonadales bacterium]MDP7313402.1 long-chain-acyl-CoA synthetase [Pseudomonadales bacterium]HJP52941.1 long-chain-acyl-CoA synthetase [Pseudomonadales bacterium]|tara:strand:- start:3339 stop:5141 length:1803 start_codon:yes stop_codon:yes gene_type:complete